MENGQIHHFYWPGEGGTAKSEDAGAVGVVVAEVLDRCTVRQLSAVTCKLYGKTATTI